jgi:hypothetical protein
MLVNIFLAIVSVLTIAISTVDARTDDTPEVNSSPSPGAISSQSSKHSLPIQGEIQFNAAKEQLTTIDLQKLSSHDIVILIDKSGSMNTCDCPKVKEGSTKGSKLMQAIMLPALLYAGYISAPLVQSSRWDWCAEQTIHMARQTQSALLNGFTVVTFADGFKIHKNMTVETLPQLFTAKVPFGGTYLRSPLEGIFKDYFERRRLDPQTKPLSIGIITDGAPLDKHSVPKAIETAVKQMNSANEITIVFFVVGGMDFDGKAYVNHLVHKMNGKKLQYHIVKAVSFKELKEFGLGHCLANNLQ